MAPAYGAALVKMYTPLQSSDAQVVVSYAAPAITPFADAVVSAVWEVVRLPVALRCLWQARCDTCALEMLLCAPQGNFTLPSLLLHVHMAHTLRAHECCFAARAALIWYSILCANDSPSVSQIFFPNRTSVTLNGTVCTDVVVDVVTLASLTCCSVSLEVRVDYQSGTSRCMR